MRRSTRLSPLSSATAGALLAAGSTLLIFAGLMQCSLFAQETLSLTSHDTTLPDAPHLAQAATESRTIDPQQAGRGSISGTVFDRNRDVLQGARVTLTGPSASVSRTVESGNDGQFIFTQLPPDVYQLTVTAPGMATFTFSSRPSPKPGPWWCPISSRC